MNPSEKKQQHDPQLHAVAEAQLASAPKEAPKRTAEQLLHELQVHQIELEMQNETLRESQRALEESRDRYVDLYEFAPLGYLSLTDKGLITEINLAGAALLGVDRSKLISGRFAKFVAARDGDRWHRLFLSTLRQQEQRSDELMLQRGDGSEFQALIDCRHPPVDGAVGSVLLTLTDITDRVLLKQSEQIFRAIFESSPIGIGIAGPDMRYRRVNPALCRMLGYSEAELLGMRYTDV
ncbi:MAG: PAS domain S-box protein, partial [Rhodocyclales bacterium]|nr:PAS domain S-box protein [Rhodocyclales bacterium]